MPNESEAPEPLRDFADRAIREELRKFENLRDFLMFVLPDVAAGFVFERGVWLNPEFRLPDWHRREADLLCEIPYRFADGERPALVCVLIEHQTQADPRMPLRMYLEIALYWERKWRDWEEAPSPKDEFRLPPVLPIVFHTGTRPWGSARTLTEMLGPPESLHRFSPPWSPIFWELSAHEPDELLDADGAFLKVLAVVRVEDRELDEFKRVFQETWRRLEYIHEGSHVRWADLAQFLFGWAFHRRPEPERRNWMVAAADAADRDEVRKEISNMGQMKWKTAYDVAVEEGFEKGMEKGIEKGLQGQVDFARRLLLRQIRKLFGEACSEIEGKIKSIADVDRLEELLVQLQDGTSQDEFSRMLE